VFESQGNLNNHIGVPLSLLQLEERHELAVVELGMNHAGELRELGRISSPTGAVIANVASVHLEFFADLDDIARAKGEVLESLPGDGLLVYNADDPRVTRLAAQYAGRKASFGLEKEADVRIDGCEFHSLDEMRFELSAVGERLPIRVPFAGRHFLYNLAAAAASGLSFGLNLAEIRRGMEALEPAAMRGQVLRIEHGRRSGVAIWDDSYNANPFAMEAVLDTVARLRGFSRKVLALGEMLELGSTAAVLHRETGRRAAASGADLLITVGAHGVSIGEGAREAGMRADQVGQFATSELAAEFLREEVRPGDLVLVKGSRGVRMDRIVQSLRECD
jgi:UDP-N-acetylmuramoyl-tripeptide--D-alanyl-D-alanine ligase